MGPTSENELLLKVNLFCSNRQCDERPSSKSSIFPNVFQQLLTSGDVGSQISIMFEKIKHFLDQEVQTLTSEILKDKSASVCVMDIYTGDIVSMVSNPTFDSNKFVHGISQKDWQTLIKDKKKFNLYFNIYQYNLV
mgnify:CR=1 FL=1